MAEISGSMVPEEDGEEVVDPALDGYVSSGESEDELLKEAITRKRLARLMGVANGTLTFEEYKELDTDTQRYYRRRWGRPKTPAEQDAAARQAVKRKKKKKMAKQSRKRNR